MRVHWSPMHFTSSSATCHGGRFFPSSTFTAVISHVFLFTILQLSPRHVSIPNPYKSPPHPWFLRLKRRRSSQRSHREKKKKKKQSFETRREIQRDRKTLNCSEMTAELTQLPPGFRFHPTDEELVVHYLCRRCASQPIAVPIIAEIDLYKFDPWDLPGNYSRNSNYKWNNFD